MAEAIFRLSAPAGVEVHSAGIEPGEEVNPNAVTVVRELGGDLSGHRPKHISEFQKHTFDFVAKMDVPDVSRSVSARWIETWDVPDPAKGGLDEYRKVRDMLVERIHRLLGKAN